MKMFNFFILLFFISKSMAADNRWEAPAANTLGVRIAFTTPSLGVKFSNKDSAKNDAPIDYQPNSPTRTAVTLFYDHFALTASAVNPLSDQIIAERGSTRSQDYQFRFYNWMGTWDLFYQKYSGYFIQNTTSVEPNRSNNDYKIIREDLSTSHLGLQFMYLFSPENYSLGGTFDQNIRQTQSGGSLFYSGYLGRHEITASSSIIPVNLAHLYQNLSTFQSGTFQDIRVGLGYAYTFVFRNFYSGLLFGITPGLQQQVFSLKDESFNRWVTATGGHIKIGLGYNGKKIYSGLQFVVETFGISINDYQIGLDTSEVKVFIGTRFSDIKIKFINVLGAWLYGEN